MRKILIGAFAVLSLYARAGAGEPAQNVDPRAHPNLAEAQRLSALAWQRIAAAQVANRFMLGGHAQRAKDLLEQANAQLKLAADTADRNRR